MTSLPKFFLLVCLTAASLPAQTPDPAQLVKDAAANEVRATEHPTDSWMYQLTKETKSGTQVRDMIEAKDGIVARVISVNGKPLTAEERVADDDRLGRFIHDPAEQGRKFSEQRKQEDRFLGLIRALPNAFIYAYDGAEQIDGREVYRLKFRSNSSFHPTTRETIIFRAAEGMIWIDALEKRIVKFDGTQTADIDIAWGLLGHIEKGSKLQLEQRRLEEGHWRFSKLVLEGNGQIFVFKTIALKQRQVTADFRPVPANLSVAHAVDLLKQRQVAIAERNSR